MAGRRSHAGLAIYIVGRYVGQMRRLFRLLVAALVLASCGHPFAGVEGTVSCAAGLPGRAAGTPPDLPTDRGVGRAELVYRPCPDCGAWLVTTEGLRYALPA